MGEKDTHPDWIEPAGQSQQQGQYAAPTYPPPGQPQMYASRDSAPQGQYAPPPSYYPPPGGPPPQSQYSSQGPPPGYYPPRGDVKYEYDQKGYDQVPSGPSGPSGPPAMYATYEAGPAPDSSAGPSGSQEGNKGGIMMTLGSFFGPQGPPPMWQRHAPPDAPYNAFPPMCLISNGHDLTKGFPDLVPPCQMNPHPFAMHDVTEEDWKRFLADIKKAASLSPVQRLKSNVIPMATGVGMLGGFLMTHMIEKKMVYKNRTAAGDVVDHWNHYFFGPRRMELVLCQASERLSGKFGAAPAGVPSQISMANGLRHRTDSDDSDDDLSSSEDERHSHGDGHGHNQNHGYSDRRARRAMRREARHERREERRARRAERRARKARGENKVPYELFITAI